MAEKGVPGAEVGMEAKIGLNDGVVLSAMQ